MLKPPKQQIYLFMNVCFLHLDILLKKFNDPSSRISWLYKVSRYSRNTNGACKPEFMDRRYIYTYHADLRNLGCTQEFSWTCGSVSSLVVCISNMQHHLVLALDQKSWTGSVTCTAARFLRSTGRQSSLLHSFGRLPHRRVIPSRVLKPYRHCPEEWIMEHDADEISKPHILPNSQALSLPQTFWNSKPWNTSHSLAASSVTLLISPRHAVV